MSGIGTYFVDVSVCRLGKAHIPSIEELGRA